MRTENARRRGAFTVESSWYEPSSLTCNVGSYSIAFDLRIAACVLLPRLYYLVDSKVDVRLGTSACRSPSEAPRGHRRRVQPIFHRPSQGMSVHTQRRMAGWIPT